MLCRQDCESLSSEILLEPLKTLVETVSGAGVGGLDEPLACRAVSVEIELVDELRGGHGVGHVLLVVVDEESALAQVLRVEDSVELLLGLQDAIAVRSVDDKDHAVDAAVVVSPEGTDLVLASDVPDGEGDVLVLDGFDVEADGGDGGDDLTETQFVQDRGLSGGVEADHDDLALLGAKVAKEALKCGLKGSHCCCLLLVAC